MFPRAVKISYILVKIVPVIPFALTTRVGVAEKDGTPSINSSPKLL